MKSLVIFLYTFFILSMNIIFAQSVMEKIDYANEIYYSNPDSSFIICNQVEKELEGSSDSNALAEVYLQQGRYLLLKTNFDQATTVINKALTIFEKKKNLSRMAKCHSLKSILIGRIGDLDKAKKHQQKALSLYTEANDLEGQINALTNISLDFVESQQNDSALFYLSKLKRFANEMKESSLYYMYQNFGTYFYNMRDYQASLNEFDKAYEIANKLDMVDSKATILMLTSKTHLALRQYQLAENKLNRSLAIATGANLLHESNEAYNMLIDLNEELGHYKEAFQLKKLNDEIEKKIYNLEKINKINEIEGQLKLTEKEKIITQKELQLKNEQLNTIQAESRITQLIFVVALSILIIIFVVIILFRVNKLNNRIQEQKKMLEQKNTEITDSITYAQRIQTAILPDTQYFEKHLPNSFILYKPKDIVAGDFYWMKVLDENVLFAAADCTGHGVPGAMVSVVCSNALNQSIKELKTTDPCEILELTRKLVKESLTSRHEIVKDGMDISLCSINRTKNELSFTGANNPVYIIREKELIEIKGDKQPIGKYFNEKPFTKHTLKLSKGDMIYTFTDGFADQFGGNKGKKFMYKKLKALFLEISNKPMNEQKSTLDHTFKTWKGNLEQIDDVCVIGVRI